MKKLHIFLKILLLGFILLFILLFVHFIFKIHKESVDSSYLWNISYENLTFKNGSKESNIVIKENGLYLNTVFTSEGDFYEFEIDVINNGTLTAKITNIDIAIDNEKEVLKVELFDENEEELRVGEEIKSKEKKRIRIKISYPKQDKKIYEALYTKISFQIDFTSISG